MRRTKNIDIEGFSKSFTVNELSVAQVMELMQDNEIFSDTSLAGLQKALARVLPQVSNVTVEDLKKMAPSEIRVLWEGFKEVNSDFFEVSRALGVTGLLEEIKLALMSDFSKLLVSFLSPAMTESLSTDTPSSATH